jgi:hypothetical protein
MSKQSFPKRGQSRCPDDSNVPRCRWPCGERIQRVNVEGFLQSEKEQMIDFHELIRQKPFSLFIQSDLSHLPNMIDISLFGGEDADFIVRFHHLGNFSWNRDCYDAPIYKVLHFI